MAAPTALLIVHKTYGDSFEDTDLESVLAEREVGRLVVPGAQTDMCIRSTLQGAIVRAYDATLEEAETRKSPNSRDIPGVGALSKRSSAASYSPTGSPLQYHRRCEA